MRKIAQPNAFKGHVGQTIKLVFGAWSWDFWWPRDQKVTEEK